MNYPNPFGKRTRVEFVLQTPAEVSVRVYDMLGRQICTLMQGKLPAGKHTVRWDGRDRWGRKVRSGIYFYKVTAGKRVQVAKLVLLR